MSGNLANVDARPPLRTILQHTAFLCRITEHGPNIIACEGVCLSEATPDLHHDATFGAWSFQIVISPDLQIFQIAISQDVQAVSRNARILGHMCT